MIAHLEESLVLDLQRLAQDNSTDVVELVRRAKVVATKLKLMAFASVLDSELSGYAVSASVPPYRSVPTTLVSVNPFHGIRPVEFQAADALYDHFATSAIRQPLSVLADLVSRARTDAGTGGLQIPLNPNELTTVSRATRAPDGIGFRRELDVSAVVGILHAVRDQILQWALDLEAEGIVGEGMTFSPKDQAAAQASSVVNITNYGVLVQGNATAATQVDRSPGTTVAPYSSGPLTRLDSLPGELDAVDPAVATAMRRFVTALRSDTALTAQTKDEVAEHVVAISQQILEAPKSRMTAVVPTLEAKVRDSLSLSADVLQVWGVVSPLVLTALGILVK